MVLTHPWTTQVFSSSVSWSYRIPHPAIDVPRKRKSWAIMEDGGRSRLPAHAACSCPLILLVLNPGGTTCTLWWLLAGLVSWGLRGPCIWWAVLATTLLGDSLPGPTSRLSCFPKAHNSSLQIAWPCCRALGACIAILSLEFATKLHMVSFFTTDTSSPMRSVGSYGSGSPVW